MRAETEAYRTERKKWATQPRLFLRVYHVPAYDSTQEWPFARDYASGPVLNVATEKIQCIRRASGNPQRVDPIAGTSDIGSLSVELVDLAGEITRQIADPALPLAASLGGPFPSYLASGPFTAGTGAITPPLPADTIAGDVALLVVQSENQTISLTTANGFAEVGAQANKAAGTAGVNPATRLATYWKRLVGGDLPPVVADSGDHTAAQIHVFRGCSASGNPWDVFAEGNDSAANDTTGSIPGATSTVANCLVVLLCATSFDGTSTAEFSGWTNAGLTNLLERQDNCDTAGLGGGHGMATGERAVAGAYGATTVTLANTSFKGTMSIALKPEITLKALGDGTGYPKKGTVTVDGEDITYTGYTVASDETTFSGITRAARGTAEAAHVAGALVHNGEQLRKSQRMTLFLGYAPMDEDDYGPGPGYVKLSVESFESQNAGQTWIIRAADIQRFMKQEVFTSAVPDAPAAIGPDHPLTIALKVMLSTGSGVNGAYDVLPASMGAAVPPTLVATEILELLRDSLFPGLEMEFADVEATDSKAFIEEQIFRPLNLVPHVTQRGRYSARALRQPTFARSAMAVRGLVVGA
jgi:hypothetical protein